MPGPAKSYGPDHYHPDEAVSYVSLTIINNFVLYSTAALLVYELVTSLDDEVAKIWSMQWRLPKILFMLNRYVIRFMLVALWILADYPGTSAEFCRIYAYWQMIPLRLAILAAQALVVMRVWAIYNNSRPMFWLLSILFAFEVGVVAACITVATSDTQGIAQPAPLSCALSSFSGYLLPRYGTGTWIAPVAFEFIMIIITLLKIIPRWTWGGKAGLLGSGGNPTLDILARDSLIYFLFIFTFSLTNAVLYGRSFSAHYRGILLGPTSAVSCIAVSRMMINIRSLPSSSIPHPSSTAAVYDRPDLSFATYPAIADQYHTIPDTAGTATFPGAAHFSPKGGKYGGGSGGDGGMSPGYGYGMPPGGYAIERGAYSYGDMGRRPSTARTSEDVTRVGDVEFGGAYGADGDDDRDGEGERERRNRDSTFEMGTMKVL
ncbi:hypothetical protein R3P38DRAFT_2743645 [Favolaschia claudopus]|uniref:DUF6533 domain-containing protein n=1 Tax=Favolaschia claudopus TaxID=2862362 RepID=A0AAV9ZKR5_9AGAR